MKSIFKRFVSVYLFMFLFSFGLIVIAVKVGLSRYYIDLTVNQITQSVSSYEKMLNSYYSGKVNRELLSEQATILGGYMGTNIWIVDSKRNIYSTSSVINNLLAEYNYEKIGNLEDDIKKVIDGNITHKEQYLYEDGLETSISVLRVGVPIKVGDEDYAIFANVPMVQIDDTIAKSSIYILLSLTFSGVLAMGIIYLITKKMSNEILQISYSAGQIASGNFDRKIRSSSVDELTQLANSFNKMAEDIKKQEQARSNFISGISHDIRTPLTTIKGYTGGVIDGTIGPEKQNRYLGIVVSECDRMLDMANDLLDLARFESGQLNLQKMDFDLDALILNVLDSFENKIIDKEIRLVIDLSKENVLAHGDVSGINRVIYNLLDNATKFVERGGTISIRTDLRNDKYFIGIGNTGKILTDEQQNKIWDRFEKLDPSRGVENKSSGLGLSIVREIIKAHGEKIDVYSNEDIGVAFIFSLQTQIFKREYE